MNLIITTMVLLTRSYRVVPNSIIAEVAHVTQMTTTLAELIKLKKVHVKPAASMLVRAFQDNPFYAYVYPDAAEMEVRLPYMFELHLLYGLHYGQTYATSSQLEGIAIWLHSAQMSMSFWRLLVSGAFWPSLKMGREAGQRIQRLSGHIGAKQKELVTFPHWYLHTLGVDPKFQGRGYAGKLLRGMLNRIDEENLPCYLETSNESNISMYRHFGFEVVDEIYAPGSTYKLWAMLRDSTAHTSG